jgi:hypothetical protein
MRLLSLLLAVTVAACGVPESPTVAQDAGMGVLVPDMSNPSPVTVEFHCDTAFTPDERVAIGQAAMLWSVQTSGLANLVLVYDLEFNSDSSLAYHVAQKHNLLKRMESWMDLIKTEDANSRGGGKVLGELLPDGGIHYVPAMPMMLFFVMDRLPPLNAQMQVPLHEFGHVFGLKHSADPNDIMAPTYKPVVPTCLHMDDIRAFCSMNECGTLRMYPCDQ